jgi:DNA-binding SARP family transcriptional activator
LARLSIRLLGPFDVTHDGTAVTGFVSDKVRALLAYLAMQPDQAHRRETLAGLLWPEYPERSARASLRNALGILRRAIGDRNASPPYLLITRQSIRFNSDSDCWLDAAGFRSAVKTAGAPVEALERAASLYRGPFLEGFSTPDSAAFEEWILLTREQFGRQVSQVLHDLVQRHQEHGAYQQALPHAWRYVELEPWREEAHRQLMLLLTHSGQRSAALNQYEACRRILAKELSVEPEPETTRLYEQIRDGEVKASDLASEHGPATERAPRLPRFLTDEQAAPQPPLFVARRQELAWLEGKLAETLAGRGQVVFVTGGPGRGKTTLLAEFARRAMQSSADLLVATGTCNAYSGVGDPHLPFREILAMLTGDVEASYAAGAISRDHALRLWTALPQACQALLDHGPHVAPALISCPALLDRAEAAAPGGATWLRALTDRIDCSQTASEILEEAGLYQQVTNLLRALAAAQPLLLVLDDLQWIDEASAGLLFHLGRRLAGSRILIAAAYRPAEIAPRRPSSSQPFSAPHPLEKVLAELQREFGDLKLDLSKIRQQEQRRFVDELLDSEPNRFGAHFRSTLFAHTAGQPLFTVELLRAMQERGDLVRDQAGSWVEGSSLDWSTLPPRIEGIIQGRIGRLDQHEREFLSVASVEGETFTAQVTARIQGLSDRQALQLLARDLDGRHHLVREHSLSSIGPHRLARYRFSHVLFRRYLYGNLGQGERALLHGEVVEVLESLYQNRLEGVAVVLAHHSAQAHDRHRSLKYFTLAGHVALDSYGNHEAEDYYRQALALQPPGAEAAELFSRLGEALARQNRFQEAGAAWLQGIQHYQALGDLDNLALLYARSAWAARQANDPDGQLALCLEGVKQVGEAADGPGLARLLHETARAYADHARSREAEPFAGSALEMAERLDDEAVRVRTLAALSAPVTPSVGGTITIAARAAELAEAHGLLLAAQHAHRDLAAAHASLGDYPAAREHCLRGADLARQAGSTAAQARLHAFLVHLAAFFGDLEGAERALSQAQRLLQDLHGPTRAEARVLLEELWYLAHLGQWDTCIQKARTVLASLRERGAERDLAEALLTLGQAIVESHQIGQAPQPGKWQEAEAALSEAAEIFDRSSSPPWGTYARILLGSLYLRLGRTTDAQWMLARAREGDRLYPLFWLIGPRQWLEGQLAAASGRWAEAIDHFETSSQTHHENGSRWWWARLRLDWVQAHASRGEPGDEARAAEMLREAREAFQDMGVPRYAAIAQERLQALGAAATPTAG